MSLALLSYVVAWGAVVGFLGVWAARTLIAERQAGSAGLPVRRGPLVRRLDVVLVLLALVAAGACALRMVLVLSAAH